MAKTFIFFRGPKSERRQRLTEHLRGSLAGAVWIAMDRTDSDPKRAHARCMAATREALQSPTSSLICVDNESFLPIHWQAYYAIAERLSIATLVVGIDILDSTDAEKLNLQLQNCALFIATVDKYRCVKTDADADEVGIWVNDMGRE